MDFLRTKMGSKGLAVYLMPITNAANRWVRDNRRATGGSYVIHATEQQGEYTTLKRLGFALSEIKHPTTKENTP